MLCVREYIAVIFFFSYTFVCYPILYSPITTHIFLSLPPPRIVRSCVFFLLPMKILYSEANLAFWKMGDNFQKFNQAIWRPSQRFDRLADRLEIIGRAKNKTSGHKLSNYYRVFPTSLQNSRQTSCQWNDLIFMRKMTDVRNMGIFQKRYKERRVICRRIDPSWWII